MNKNNVLQFSSSNTRFSRKKKNNTNYFKALFFISLGLNIILILKVILKI